MWVWSVSVSNWIKRRRFITNSVGPGCGGACIRLASYRLPSHRRAIMAPFYVALSRSFIAGRVTWRNLVFSRAIVVVHGTEMSLPPGVSDVTSLCALRDARTRDVVRWWVVMHRLRHRRRHICAWRHWIQRQIIIIIIVVVIISVLWVSRCVDVRNWTVVRCTVIDLHHISCGTLSVTNSVCIWGQTEHHWCALSYPFISM